MIPDWSGVALVIVPARCGAFVGVDLGFHLRDGGLDIFELQLILGRIDLLRFGPEERLLKRGNQSLKPRILIQLRTDDRLQLSYVIG